MANYENLIPFIFHFAAGVYGKNGNQLSLPLDQQFEIAKCQGWSDDPDDPGGATMIDITLSTYTDYRRFKGIISTTKTDLHSISFDEWKDILKTIYWDKWHADAIKSQGIANILVDWTWASGYSSIRHAQKIIGSTPDGIVGPKTIAAINETDCFRLFHKIQSYRETYFRNCSASWKFLKGWLRRLYSIQPDGSFIINSTVINRQ